MKVLLTFLVVVLSHQVFADVGVVFGFRYGGLDNSALPANPYFGTFSSNKLPNAEIGALYETDLTSYLGIRTGLMYIPLTMQLVLTVPSYTSATLTSTQTLNTLAVPFQFLIHFSNSISLELGGYFWDEISVQTTQVGAGLTYSGNSNYNGNATGVAGRVGIGIKPASYMAVSFSYEPSVTIGTTNITFGSTTSSTTATVSTAVADFAFYF